MKLLSKIPISKIELIALLYIFLISIADIILRISFIITIKNIKNIIYFKLFYQ